jgi:hypothetical protein
MSHGGNLLGVPLEEQKITEQNRICQTPSSRWEHLWVWASERMNPIVIKEVRQSLKSKQFTASFGLTLLAAVGWTFIAVSMMVPSIFYLPAGMELLTGFLCILAFPLMVVIPFGTFMSLTAETDDSTFELLSISALSSFQIIYGKMASALLQLLLYLSALAPCIVLTYLLRGVSLFSIGFILGLTILFSIAETALALLFASISRTKVVQVGMMVLVLGGLLLGFFGWTALMVEAADEFSNPPREIYLTLFAVVTVVAVAISLVLRTAAAAIDFPSENHSTSLRWRVLGLLCIYLFWMLLLICATQESGVAPVLLITVFVVMMFFGALITGERGVVSLRAQRSLPKTFLGRVFLSFLYPGAGLGYIFLVAAYAALTLTMVSFELFYASYLTNYASDVAVVATGYLLLCYLVIYVGVNRILMLALAPYFSARMLGALAMFVVVLLLAHLVPWMLAFVMNDYREFPYAWHQAFNIVLTVLEANDRLSLDIGAAIFIVTLCASGIFGLNLLLSTRDIMLVRVALPPRVREEEGILESETAPPKNPFLD